MVNWNKLLDHDKFLMVNFALGVASRREVERNLVYTPVSGEFRRLVRTRGVAEARRVARKALRRRNIL